MQRFAHYITATYCNTLQHTASRCNMTGQRCKWHSRNHRTLELRHDPHTKSLQHAATHGNTLQHTTQQDKGAKGIRAIKDESLCVMRSVFSVTHAHSSECAQETRCNTLQHAQHTATRCNTPTHAHSSECAPKTRCTKLQHAQHTAVNCDF